MKSILRFLLSGLLVVFIIIQFFGVDRTVPERDTSATTGIAN